MKIRDDEYKSEASGEPAKFYLIETEYVGPNKRNSEGNWIGDSRCRIIQSRPGYTNSSREPRVSGWLGTTNDNSAYALGEFDSIEDARKAARYGGFVPLPDYDCDESEIEAWVPESASRQQWDAGDWFINAIGRDGVRDEFGITESTTDDELCEAVTRAVEEARDEDIELHGTVELFAELRDECS